MATAEFFKALLDNLYDGVYFVDRERCITYWNKGAVRLTGYTAEEAMGRHCQANFLNHVDDAGHMLCRDGCPLSATLADGRQHEASVWLRHKNGHRVPVQVRVSPLHDEAGEIIGAVEIFSDISAAKEVERRVEELQSEALLCPLTQVANRRLLERGLASRHAQWQRYEIPYGVLYMDVDHFKQFNDRHGHDAGDRVLRAVSETMKHALRPSDMFGRWGGEEFLAVVGDGPPQGLVSVAERCRALVAETVLNIDEARLSVTLSIGGAWIEEGDTIASLLKRADARLYEAKGRGRNCVSVDVGAP